jgi:hypothetical protein
MVPWESGVLSTVVRGKISNAKERVGWKKGLERKGAGRDQEGGEEGEGQERGGGRRANRRSRKEREGIAREQEQGREQVDTETVNGASVVSLQC